jgi:methylthioribulose-1-phosphate dehydratase
MSSLAQLNTLDPSAVARDLISAGQIMGARGWVPATSGNLSSRIDAGTIAITASGIDKSSLQPQHILTVSLNEPPPRNASAETGLHVAAYHRDAEIGAVLHVHSLNATLLSRRFAGQGCVKLSGFELFKAFAGFKTHDVAVEVPIFANSQDVPALAQKVEAGLSGGPKLPGYLLAGHGLYTWGRNLGEAMRHLEAFEFLFSCVMAEA